MQAMVTRLFIASDYRERESVEALVQVHQRVGKRDLLQATDRQTLWQLVSCMLRSISPLLGIDRYCSVHIRRQVELIGKQHVPG